MSEAAYPELLSDLAARAEQLLRAEGLPDTQARTVAFKIAECVRKHWGGQQVYIPIGREYEISQRDEQMWQKFNGHNHEDLVREFGVTLVHVYRVVGKMARLVRERDQGRLFAEARVVSSAATNPASGKN